MLPSAPHKGDSHRGKCLDSSNPSLAVSRQPCPPRLLLQGLSSGLGALRAPAQPPLAQGTMVPLLDFSCLVPVALIWPWALLGWDLVPCRTVSVTVTP